MRGARSLPKRDRGASEKGETTKEEASSMRYHWGYIRGYILSYIGIMDKKMEPKGIIGVL